MSSTRRRIRALQKSLLQQLHPPRRLRMTAMASASLQVGTWGRSCQIIPACCRDFQKFNSCWYHRNVLCSRPFTLRRPYISLARMRYTQHSPSST